MTNPKSSILLQLVFSCAIIGVLSVSSCSCTKKSQQNVKINSAKFAKIRIPYIYSRLSSCSPSTKLNFVRFAVCFGPCCGLFCGPFCPKRAHKQHLKSLLACLTFVKKLAPNELSDQVCLTSHSSVQNLKLTRGREARYSFLFSYFFLVFRLSVL